MRRASLLLGTSQYRVKVGLTFFTGQDWTYMGLFPPGFGEVGAPQGPTRCAPGAPLLGQYCLLWGESPNMTSPVHHQKPPCAYKHSSRQQHYNPPILDSTQFPQLGRTTNNPHPTLSFPIHNPPIPHDVMIQRQSSPGGLEGGFMKTERTSPRSLRVQSTLPLSVLRCRPQPDGALEERLRLRSP